MATLTIIRSGMLTTVQDLGRWGYQNLGVPVGGPMDVYSHRLANLMVGNGPSAAALEVTLVGPELQADANVVCAITGARFELFVNDAPVPAAGVMRIPPGGRLRFGSRLAGARATLAVRGGFDVPAVFGSRATHLVSRMGPFDGRPVATGSVLPIGGAGMRDLGPAGPPLPLPEGGARLRVVMGPHDDMFTTGARETLVKTRYVITAQSNRMGYRLEGAALSHAASADILSDATPIGSLQVPASGQPILLMADRQTTGGYPKIATVIAADLPVAGQLAPGDWVEFSPVSRSAAVDALRRQEARLSGGAR